MNLGIVSTEPLYKDDVITSVRVYKANHFLHGSPKEKKVVASYVRMNCGCHLFVSLDGKIIARDRRLCREKE